MSGSRAPQLFTLWLMAGNTFGDIMLLSVDEELIRVEHTELWVPRTFVARFDREGLPIVELEVEYFQHERFRCRSVRVVAREGDSISTATVRLPVAKLVDEALERVSYRQIALADNEMVDGARAWFQEFADLRSTPVSLDKIQVDDVFRFPVALGLLVTDDDAEYEETFGRHVRALLAGANHSRPGAVSPLAVAHAYHEALEAGEQTAEYVARKFHWSQSHAQNAIADSRKAGFLPPTKPGQALGFQDPS